MSDDDDEPEFDPTRFPITAEDIAKIKLVCRLLREQLSVLAPRDVKCAAVVLCALERLPLVTQGVEISFGFVQPNCGGNFGWADIEITESEFTLSIGEHVHDPSVGGDTESRHAFEAYAGADLRTATSTSGWRRPALFA